MSMEEQGRETEDAPFRCLQSKRMGYDAQLLPSRLPAGCRRKRPQKAGEPKYSLVDRTALRRFSLFNDFSSQVVVTSISQRGWCVHLLLLCWSSASPLW